MNSTTINVLLVEGDADETALVKRQLEAPGGSPETFLVTGAVRLSAACHLLARESFDAIILDLVLPQSVGIEGFRRVHAQKPHTPIIVLTGLADEALAREAVKLGAQDYILKGSLDHCLLKRAVRHAIERKTLLNELERLLELDASGKAVLDESGGVLFVNSAAESMLAPRAELLGRPLPSRLPASVEAVSAPLRWNGEPARLVTLRDFSEACALERLRAEREQRSVAAEAKEVLMARAGHELRNTLAAVKTAAFCLGETDGGNADRSKRLSEMIARNVDRQAKLLDDILDLARLQGGGPRPALRPVDLAEVLQETAREAALRGRPGRLDVEAPAHLPAVLGDPDLLGQVVRHLLDNAFRHARERVVLSASLAEGGEIRVTVADDGEGIPPERLDRVFSHFVDLAKDAASRKGVGLGLAVSREIVEAHHGRIWAESPAGGGARFHVSLPRHEARGAEPAGSVPERRARGRRAPETAAASQPVQ